VELPGIEPTAEMAVTCGYTNGVDGINTTSAS